MGAGIPLMHAGPFLFAPTGRSSNEKTIKSHLIITYFKVILHKTNK
jgi:hypothetical protein